MAPEVMFRQQHSFPVDYYAMGVIAFEMMLGRVQSNENKATLYGPIKSGNKGINICQIGLSQTERDSKRMVS